MKKYYFYRQKPWIYILYSVITIILVACIIVNFLRLFTDGDLQTINLPLDITATCVMTVALAVMTAIVMFSGYRLGDKYLWYNIILYVKKIAYDDILLIRADSEQTMLFIYVRTDSPYAAVEDAESGLKADVLQINVSKIYHSAIVGQIKAHNPRAVYEILPTPHKSEPKKEDKK